MTVRRIRVKVCGITNEADARLAVQYGADAIGFIFAPSPRQITVATARAIAQNLPPWVARVGVFQDHTLDEVEQVMDQVGLTHAQLHGSESPDFVHRLNGRAVKVFRLSEANLVEEIRRYACHTIMLDLAKHESAHIISFIEVARAVAAHYNVILAGGLTPDCVKQVIVQAKPYAVDVARGVEARPGEKDQVKMERFFQQVREAEHEL